MAIANPCALLDRLIAEAPECEWIEFKLNYLNLESIGAYTSALANAAILAEKDRAFLVFGVDDKTYRKVGTTVILQQLKKSGGEPFTNWITRLLDPRLMIEFVDFECAGKNFSIMSIEPTFDRPVRFCGTEFIRIGENTKKLRDFPEHERSLWLATSRRKFEQGIAVSHQSSINVLSLLHVDTVYTLTNAAKPANETEKLHRLRSLGAIIDDLEGGFNITNLGAILFARDVRDFPSISTKSVRLIKYSGRDKRHSESEEEGQMGYAVGFSNLIRYLMGLIPAEEQYIDGVRKVVTKYPQTAIREVIANAMIHQDLTITGSGPVVELYADRIEVINPGNSLIDPDRMLDERRSRNEKLAAVMRELGLCEERGGGLDKALIEIELQHLPAPEFNSSKDSMRVVLFGPRPFRDMSKKDKIRACFYHCVLRWINHEPMSNSSFRERFKLADEDYQSVSAVISEAIRLGRIIPADPNQGRRNARYIPYWAG